MIFSLPTTELEKVIRVVLLAERALLKTWRFLRRCQIQQTDLRIPLRLNLPGYLSHKPFFIDQKSGSLRALKYSTGKTFLLPHTYSCNTFPSESLNRTKGNSYFCLNFWWDLALSLLTPTITAPCFSSSSTTSLNSTASRVHPGASSIGLKIEHHPLAQVILAS